MFDSILISISSSEFKALISSALEKSFYENVIMGLTVFASFATALVLWKGLQDHSKNVIRERIIEQDTHKLYEAFDGLFSFFDAANLYLSLQIKLFNKKKDGGEIETELADKIKRANESIYDEINSIRKTEYILKLLGDDNSASHVEMVREIAISARRSIYRWNSNSPLEREDLELILIELTGIKIALQHSLNKSIDGMRLLKGSAYKVGSYDSLKSKASAKSGTIQSVN